MAIQLTLDDSVELAYNASTRIALDGAWTVALWVRTTTDFDDASDHIVFGIHSNSFSRYVLFTLTGVTTSTARVNILSSSGDAGVAGTTFGQDEDHYFVITCDGAATPTYEVYVDGVLENSLTITIDDGGVEVYEWGLMDGFGNDWSGFNGNAGFAAIKMWAAEKVAATINTNESPYRNAQDTVDLIDEWHLDTAATAAASESGNNDLTVNGTLADEADPPDIEGDDPSGGAAVGSGNYYQYYLSKVVRA